MKFIKENKSKIIIGVICLCFVLLLTITICSIFDLGNSKKIYGSRLDGEVSVSDTLVENVKSKIFETGFVNDISYNKNIRIIKFIIDVKDNTNTNEAIKLGDTILSVFSKEILSYYDVEVYITSNSKDYPIIGYHSKSSTDFKWTINRGEVSE